MEPSRGQAYSVQVLQPIPAQELSSEIIFSRRQRRIYHIQGRQSGKGGMKVILVYGGPCQEKVRKGIVVITLRRMEWKTRQRQLESNQIHAVSIQVGSTSQ